MSTFFIESEANARVKRWKKLVDQPRQIKKEGATVIEGIHLLEVALAQTRYCVSSVMIDEKGATPEARVLAENLAQTHHAHLYEMSASVFRSICPVENGVGVMAEISLEKAFTLEDVLDEDVLYLDGVQDAGNAGTLIRTALAAGVQTIVASPKTVSLFSAKVLRAAMGAHFAAKIVENVTIEAFKAHYQGVIYAADARGGKNIYAHSEALKKTSVAWVLGAEGPGVSLEALECVQERFYIPIEAATESLNVGVAGALCLFEMRRVRC